MFLPSKSLALSNSELLFVCKTSAMGNPQTAAAMSTTLDHYSHTSQPEIVCLCIQPLGPGWLPTAAEKRQKE